MFGVPSRVGSGHWFSSCPHFPQLKHGRRDLEWILYLMVRCVGQMYGTFHHSQHDFTCSLYLPCARYDDILGMLTLNVLSYHIRWWHSLDSYCSLLACLTLGLQLGIWICHHLNWKKKPLLLGPHKMMRWPHSLPIMWSCLGLILSSSYNLCLSGECDFSRQYLKAWGMSLIIVSASKICRMIHPWLDKNQKWPN